MSARTVYRTEVINGGAVSAPSFFINDELPTDCAQLLRLIESRKKENTGGESEARARYVRDCQDLWRSPADREANKKIAGLSAREDYVRGNAETFGYAQPDVIEAHDVESTIQRADHIDESESSARRDLRDWARDAWKSPVHFGTDKAA